MYIKQCKGREIGDSIPAGVYFVSKKYDGVYTQLHFKDGKLKVFLSSGKELKNALTAKLEKELQGYADFIVEAELIYKNGGIGDRYEVDKFIKGNSKESISSFKFIVFYLMYGVMPYATSTMQRIVEVREHISCIEDVERIYKRYAGGAEGIMLRSLYFKYLEGKRVNTLLKYKPYYNTKGVIDRIVENTKVLTLYIRTQIGTAKVNISKRLWDGYVFVGDSFNFKYTTLYKGVYQDAKVALC